jgi:hypothetical protein
MLRAFGTGSWKTRLSIRDQHRWTGGDLESDGQKEILPRYDKDGKASCDPDAGEGIKYVFEKKKKNAPWNAQNFPGLPTDDCFRENADTTGRIG